MCTTGSVHTLTCCTHIFLYMACAQSHPHIFVRVTCTHDLRVPKGSLHMCRFSPSRLLPSHVSPVSAVPARSLRDHLSVHNLAVLSRPKSAGRAQLCTCIAKFGYLAKSDANTVYEPKEFDKITSVDNDTMFIDDPDLK